MDQSTSEEKPVQMRSQSMLTEGGKTSVITGAPTATSPPRSPEWGMDSHIRAVHTKKALCVLLLPIQLLTTWIRLPEAREGAQVEAFFGVDLG